MLKGTLIHPDILRVLGRSGHGSQVLIADGNFPFASCLGPNATLVSLNLSPGVVGATQVLEALVSAIEVEAAAVMDYPSSGPFALGSDPDIWADYGAMLSPVMADGGRIDRIERFAFYEAVRQPSVVLTIATAEQRTFANLLLTIGVVHGA